MRPFDLEAAKAGKPVCTRDGRPARVICFDRKGYGGDLANMIIALVSNKDDFEEVVQYRRNGMYQGIECNLDLMMAPEKKEGWANLYAECDGVAYAPMSRSVGALYATEKEAKTEAKDYPDTYITTIKIEWEE